MFPPKALKGVFLVLLWLTLPSWTIASSAGLDASLNAEERSLLIAQLGRDPADLLPERRPQPRLNVKKVRPTEALSPREAENRSLTLEGLRNLQETILAEQRLRTKQAQKSVIEKHRLSVALALQPEADDLFGVTEKSLAFERRKACAADDQTACSDLGQMYQTGEGTNPDLPLAFGFFLFACMAGDDLGCARFRNSQWLEIRQSAYPGPYPDVPHFLRRCEEGLASACSALGSLYRYGYRSDVEKDEERGIAYMSRACILGDEKACGRSRLKKPTLDDITSGCDADDRVACYWLAELYARDQDFAKDRAKSVALYQKSCDLGWGPGCGGLARLHEVGQGVEKDTRRALSLLVQACELPPKSERVCRNVAQRFETGQGTAIDLTKALALYKLACDVDGEQNHHCSDFWRLTAATFEPLDPRADALFVATDAAVAAAARESCAEGDASACRSLARLYSAEPSGERRAISSGLHLTACRLGAAEGCLTAGRLLRNQTSADLYRQACEAGLGQGCQLFSGENSVDQDQRREVLEAACAGDVAAACTVLGLSWQKNDRDAVPLLERACAKGDGDGCTYLARSIDDNDGNDDLEGLEPDLDRARELFIRGCELGSVFGCSQTAYRYRHGELFPRDLEKALIFAKQACSSQRKPCEEEESALLALERQALSDQHGDLQAVLIARYDGVKPTHIGRVRRARLWCQEGDLTACVELGGYYDISAYGDEGAVEIYATDRAWTKALYTHACDEGLGAGCYATGAMHHNVGDRSDHDLAIDYFKRACRLDHAQACAELGSSFQNGFDVIEDQELATAYFEKACELGSDYACGQGSDVKACLYVNEYACERLGRAFERGRNGYAKNDALAAELYQIGCKRRSQDACAAFQRLTE
ncbi:MAG: hypothetical protein AAGC81_16160 [Pseudomonadota bacterium]